MLARFAELMYNVFNKVQLTLMRVFNINEGEQE